MRASTDLVFVLGNFRAFAANQARARDAAEFISTREPEAHVHGSVNDSSGCCALLRTRPSREHCQHEYHHWNNAVPSQAGSTNLESRTSTRNHHCCIAAARRVRSIRSSCYGDMVLNSYKLATVRSPSRRNGNTATMLEPSHRHTSVAKSQSLLGSKRRRIIPQQRPPHNLDRGKSLPHEIIVKLLQRKRRAFLFHYIRAQF